MSDFRIDGVRRLLRFRRPSQIDNNVHDEIRFHLACRIDDLMARGFSREDAQREAEREFGDVRAAQEELAGLDRRQVARERRLGWRESIGQETRDAWRAVRRSPGFSVAVTVMIAIGVGANASMFGIVDRLLLQPPPHVVQADRLGRMYTTQTFKQLGVVTQDNAGYEHYEAMRAARSLDAVAAFKITNAAIGRGLEAREVKQSGVTPSYFSLLGVRPQLGRFFTADENLPPRGADVVVISDGLWRGQFGRRPDVLKESLLIGSRRCRIIGVAPAGLTSIDLDRIDIWVPIAATGFANLGPDWTTPGIATWLSIITRRRQGTSSAQVDAELTLLFRRQHDEMVRRFGWPPDTSARVTAGPLTAARALDGAQGHARQVRAARMATWLLGMSLLVLLIACANVANLTLSRALRRRREIAVRIALGISRMRLIRQLTTEGLLLACAGTIGGLVVAATGGAVLRRALLPTIDWEGQPLVDSRMFLFLLATIVVVTLLTAVYPARQISRPSTLDELRQGAQGGGLRRSRLRGGLLVAQAALSTVLLVAAGLFVRSLQNVLAVPMGFDAPHVMAVLYQTGGLDSASRPPADLYERAHAAAVATPGVASASLATTSPFLSSLSVSLFVPGIDSMPRPSDGGPYINGVGPEYFQTMGTRIVRGRAFTAHDVIGSERVAVLGERLAKAIWRNENPIGKCVRLGRDTAPCTMVIGIAEDARRGSLDDASFQLYVPIAQRPRSATFRVLMVRSSGDPDRLIPSLYRRLATVAPGLPYVNIRTLDSIIERQREAWRLGAVVFAIFGVTATIIATLGLYAMIVYEVARRRREFGIRIALGAGTRNIVRLVLQDGLVLTGCGLLLGCATALLGGSRVDALLYQTTARDPLVLAGVVALLIATATAACVMPSRRAARVSPVTALQAD